MRRLFLTSSALISITLCGCLAWTWTQIELPVTSLKQPTWGAQLESNWSDVNGIAFQLHARLSAGVVSDPGRPQQWRQSRDVRVLEVLDGVTVARRAWSTSGVQRGAVHVLRAPLKRGER
jgi:hypothetical protein